jgi:hypothetical protein
VKFYEYTKAPASKFRNRPANLSVTFSLSERPDAEDRAAEHVAAGHNVAVVFAASKGNLPAAWLLPGVGILPVIDGDKHDARFLDAPSSIVGLSAKGRAKRDASGFVRATS